MIRGSSVLLTNVWPGTSSNGEIMMWHLKAIPKQRQYLSGGI